MIPTRFLATTLSTVAAFVFVNFLQQQKIPKNLLRKTEEQTSRRMVALIKKVDKVFHVTIEI